MAAKFEVFKDQDGQFRWRFRATNGRIVADSAEGYKQRKACERGIEVMKEYAAGAATVDKIEETAKA